MLRPGSAHGFMGGASGLAGSSRRRRRGGSARRPEGRSGIRIPAVLDGGARRGPRGAAPGSEVRRGSPNRDGRPVPRGFRAGGLRGGLAGGMSALQVGQGRHTLASQSAPRSATPASAPPRAHSRSVKAGVLISRPRGAVALSHATGDATGRQALARPRTSARPVAGHLSENIRIGDKGKPPAARNFLVDEARRFLPSYVTGLVRARGACYIRPQRRCPADRSGARRRRRARSPAAGLEGEAIWERCQ